MASLHPPSTRSHALAFSHCPAGHRASLQQFGAARCASTRLLFSDYSGTSVFSSALNGPSWSFGDESFSSLNARLAQHLKCARAQGVALLGGLSAYSGFASDLFSALLSSFVDDFPSSHSRSSFNWATFLQFSSQLLPVAPLEGLLAPPSALNGSHTPFATVHDRPQALQAPKPTEMARSSATSFHRVLPVGTQQRSVRLLPRRLAGRRPTLRSEQ